MYIYIRKYKHVINMDHVFSFYSKSYEEGNFSISFLLKSTCEHVHFESETVRDLVLEQIMDALNLDMKIFIIDSKEVI